MSEVAWVRECVPGAVVENDLVLLAAPLLLLLDLLVLAVDHVFALLLTKRLIGEGGLRHVGFRANERARRMNKLTTNTKRDEHNEPVIR